MRIQLRLGALQLECMAGDVFSLVSLLISFFKANFLVPLPLLLISSLAFLLTLTALYRRYNRRRTAWTCVQRNTSAISTSELLTGTDTSAETEPEVRSLNNISFAALS